MKNKQLWRGGKELDVVSAHCHLCDGEIWQGETYYCVNGENVCRHCLADFAAQILAAYRVTGGEEA